MTAFQLVRSDVTWEIDVANESDAIAKSLAILQSDNFPGNRATYRLFKGSEKLVTLTVTDPKNIIITFG